MTDNALNTAADLLYKRELSTRYGPWTEFCFRYATSDILVLAYGDWSQAPHVTVRVHSTCTAAHYFNSTECDCREQLDMAFARIVELGAGLIVLLDQDGRGNGHVALMRAAQYAKQKGTTQSQAYEALGYPCDARSFEGAAVVLSKLGISSVTLLSNSPAKSSALTQRGIDVRTERLMLPADGDGSMADYYAKKALEGYTTGPTD